MATVTSAAAGLFCDISLDFALKIKTRSFLLGSSRQAFEAGILYANSYKARLLRIVAACGVAVVREVYGCRVVASTAS